MAYTARNGRKRDEHASRTAHSKIIKNPIVKDFLSKVRLPPSKIEEKSFNELSKSIGNANMFDFIIAIDGGYAEIPIEKDFPSSSLGMFQFGATLLKKDDLQDLRESEFISPQLMQKIRNVEHEQFCLPLKNCNYRNNKDFNTSFREAIFDLFNTSKESGSDYTLLDDLYWLIFRKYKHISDRNENDNNYVLSSCPNPECDNINIPLKEDVLRKNYTVKCSKCGEVIYLTDVFRLFEIVDNEQGAIGTMGYITNVLEHFMLLSLIRDILEQQADLLKNTLFVKDGPLGFFGQTANMHKFFRELIVYEAEQRKIINLVGVEKSGPFVDHAQLIMNKLDDKRVIFLTNKYINQNIKPTNDTNKEYAPTSYYSGKLIFKNQNDYIYVASIPSKSKNYYQNGDRKELIGNVDRILNTLALLKSNSFENALLPIAVINKAVSISNQPGISILEKFAKQKLNK